MQPVEARATFAADTTSSSQARRFLSATLEGWGWDHATYVPTLLLGELAANAVLHACTPFDVVVRLDGRRVRVEVHDGSSLLPSRKRYSTMAATGRGLGLVETMSSEWGTEPTDAGKLVWFEVDASSGAEGLMAAFDTDSFDLEDLLPSPPASAGPRDAGRSPAPGSPRLDGASLVAPFLVR